MNAGGQIGGDNLDDFNFGDNKAQDQGEFNFNFGAEEKKENKKLDI